MANRFANGAKAFGFCDYCNFRFPLKKLKNEVVKTKQTQIRACPQCWSMDHPQLLLGTFPVSDPQAIRDPRPDTNTWYQSGTNGLQTAPTTGTGPLQEGFPGEGMLVIQWGWNPIGGSQDFDAALTPNTLVGVGEVGTVTIGNTGTPQFTLVEALYTTPGTYAWPIPSGVTSIYVLCIGGGGAGAYDGGFSANGGSSSFARLFPFPPGALIFASGGAQGFFNGGAGGTGSPLGVNRFGGNGGSGGGSDASGATTPVGGGGGAGGYSGNGGRGEATGVFNTGPRTDGAGGAGAGGSAASLSAVSGGGAGLTGPGTSGIGDGVGGSGGTNGTVSAGGLYGGGGGGKRSSGAANGSGGGGGGGLRWSPNVALTVGDTYTVLVGAGGASGSATPGGNGAVKIAYWLPVP